jgi:hypothetical protein
MLVAQFHTRKTTIWYTVILGLFDATIGWKISMLIGANTGMTIEVTPAVFLFVVLCVAFFASLSGLIGWWLSWKLIKDRKLEY